jgi:hypothetical protein
MTPMAAETAVPMIDAEAGQDRLSKVETMLLGRYLLENGQEYACQATSLSLEAVTILAPARGAVGERVIIYLELLGRLEGEIVTHDAYGFTVSLVTTQLKRDRLATRLTWLANRDILGMADERRHDRIVPAAAGTTLRVDDGREWEVRIVDVSLSGAAIATREKLPLGTPVMIGKTRAHVVRHTDDGVAVEFSGASIRLADATVNF